MTETTDKVRDFCDVNGLTVEATFVPFSRSRHAKENAKLGDLSLNWRVSLLWNGKHVVTSDYSAGIGHCPSYPKGGGLRLCVDDAERIRKECEIGRRWNGSWAGSTMVMPDRLDVIASLLLDSAALAYDSFETWAEAVGFDSDSRKAEKVYQECMAIALKMRNGLGDDLLTKTTEAFADY